MHLPAQHPLSKKCVGAMCSAKVTTLARDMAAPGQVWADLVVSVFAGYALFYGVTGVQLLWTVRRHLYC